MKGFTTEEVKRLNYLMSETDAAYHEAAVKLKMSDSVLQILYALCDRGDGCPLSDICRLSGIGKQTVNSALRRLETENIVLLKAEAAVGSKAPDGRKKRVYLTGKGKELAECTVMRLIAIENGILNSWPQEEREQYLGLTQKYLTCFKERIQEL